MRRLFSQNSRNKKIDLIALLACPSCHSSDLKTSAPIISCAGCGASYPLEHGTPVMYPRDYIAPDNRARDTSLGNPIRQ
jgi:uncharacterized protein YbaR (Trm112 family)